MLYKEEGPPVVETALAGSHEIGSPTKAPDLMWTMCVGKLFNPSKMWVASTGELFKDELNSQIGVLT